MDALDCANLLRRTANAVDAGTIDQARADRDDCRILIAAAAILEGGGPCPAALGVIARRGRAPVARAANDDLF